MRPEALPNCLQRMEDLPEYIVCFEATCVHTGGGQARDSPMQTEQPMSCPLPDDGLVGASSETSLESLIRVSRDGGLSDTSPRQSEVGVCLPAST